ncbi:MAG: hypothetical protein WB608_08180 [Terracidiphilus sp.]
MRVLGFGSLLAAVLQSICAAILTVSGIRVAIGLTALAAGAIYGPVVRFHQDAIRIPMLILASAGAVINLLVLAWIWRLRAQPSAQWRRREISAKERRSERLQVTLALATLLLVVIEVCTHAVLSNRARQQQSAPAAIRQAASTDKQG